MTIRWIGSYWGGAGEREAGDRQLLPSLVGGCVCVSRGSSWVGADVSYYVTARPHRPVSQEMPLDNEG